MVDPRAIQVDPKTYQFKGGGDARGVTDRLAKVEQWDPLAGSASPIVVHERANGQRFVVDGHQRLGLANRVSASGQPTPAMRAIVLREQNGVSVEEARRTGAMLNLQQGTGSATDIAKVLRERALTPSERSRIPKDQTSGVKLRLGEDLAKLSDEAFQDVINGRVHPDPKRNEQFGAIVGRLMPDRGPDQIAALRELAKAAPESPYEAEQFIKAQQADGFERGVQTDLFGAQEISSSLSAPIAKVMAATRRALNSEKSALGNALRNEARLQDRGNVLNRAANESGLETATTLDALLDKYGHTTGPVRNAIKDSAAGLQRGELAPQAAADRVMAALQEAVNGEKFQATSWDTPVNPKFAGKGFDELEAMLGAEPPAARGELMAELEARQSASVDEAMGQGVTREGLPPAPALKSVEDLLPTGEAQPRLPEAGQVRDVEKSTPQMEAPFSLAAEPATRTAVQPGLRQLEDMLARVDEQPTAEFTTHRQDGTPEYIVKGGPLDRSTVSADTLRAEGIEVPQTPEFTGRKAVPANVASFLQKQLGYTPDQIERLGFDEAIRVGRERIANPNPPAPPAPPKIEPLPESRQLPSMRTFDETRQARGQQRKARLELTRAPEGPAALEAPAKIQRLAREQAGAPAAAERPAGLTPRARGEAPRQLAQRAAHMEKWMNDPTPENFARWVKEASGQAERVNEKQLRAGTSKEGNIPDKTPGGEFLASGVFPGAQLLANPKAMKAAAKMLLTSPSARAAIGAGIGYFNNDDPLQGAALGALIGAGLNKKLATETVKFLQQMVSRTAGGLTDGRGVKPVVYSSDLSRDLHPLESQFASPMRAIPEQFKKAQTELDALDQLFQGRDELGNKLFSEDVPKNAAERAAARKVYIGDAVADLRKDATKFHAAGQHRRAEYIEKIADVLREKPPAINRMVRRTTGNVGEKAMNQLVRHMYRLQLGANMGVGLVNRTQKWYALRRVPYNYITQATKFVKTDAGKNATDFLKLDHPNDAPEGFDAKTAAKLNAADRILQSPLRTGDIQNRRVVYAAARKYAADKGGVDLGGGTFDSSPDAIHRWAMDVTNETQTLPGAMGQNPFMRDLGAFSAYTKYPTMWAELMLDAMRNPDQRSVKMLAMIAGATGMSTAMGVSGIDLLIPRLIPGLGVGRAVVDTYKHATGTADHSVKEDAPGLAIPGYARKLYNELEAFGKYGTGEHQHLTPSGNVQQHSGVEALMNLLGLTSTRQANERSVINEEMQRRNQRQIDQRERSRDKRQQRFDQGQGQTLRERLRKSTPLTDRRAFDQQFQGVR